LLIKVGKKKFVFIYCTEQLNLKNISYWHYFTTKIMSICPIWNFTLYVTQKSSFFWKSPKYIKVKIVQFDTCRPLLVDIISTTIREEICHNQKF
jgi:hypothetical protein